MLFAPGSCFFRFVTFFGALDMAKQPRRAEGIIGWLPWLEYGQGREHDNSWHGLANGVEWYSQYCTVRAQQGKVADKLR